MKASEQTAKPENEPDFYFEDESDEALGIKTKSYPNGSKTKTVTLSDGRIAVARMLKGKDFSTIQRLSHKKEEYQNALIATCTEIDGKPVIKEDLTELWLSDYNKLIAMSLINF